MRLLRSVAAAAILAAVSTVAAPAEPLKLRISFPNATGSMAPIYPLLPEGLARHQGKSYVVEPMFMAGATQSLQALAAKELELAQLTPQALALGVVGAKLDLSVIAQVISTELEGYAASKFWVRKDEVKKIEDLKGKVLAVNAHGSAVAAAVTLMMRRHGMEAGRDYQVVEVRFPAMLAQLEGKRIDLAYLLRPWHVIAVKKPEFAPLFGPGEVYGPSETGVLAAPRAWIAQNRAVLVDYLEDEIRVRRWAYDPRTRMEAVARFAKAAKQPVENLAAFVLTKADTTHRDPQAMVDAARLQKNVNHMKEAGVVPDTIDVAKHVDASLAREAAARAARN
ncbi:MAG TPA: ABC transporter substrate-binding protein [Alphaproteobacteria bacterium]